MSCTPPLTINSADAEEKCDLYVTYYGDNITNEPEYFTVKVKGTASSTESVENTFMFSASVGAGAGQGDAALSIVKTGDDINQGALDIGTFDKYVGGSPVRTVTVTNQGAGDATNVFVQLDGSASNFAVYNNTCSDVLPQGTNCSFDVAFLGTTSDPVDSYFSSVSVGYDTSAGTQVESSAIVGYITDSTPVSGAFGFVATASVPNPSNVHFDSTEEFGTLKLFKVKNSSSQTVSGIYPDLQQSPRTYLNIESSTCGTSSYEDWQYNEATDTWDPVTIPASPISLAPQEECSIVVSYQPIYKIERPEEAAVTGSLTVNSTTATLVSTLSGSVSSVPGKLLVVNPATDGAVYDIESNSYTISIDHPDFYSYGPRIDYSAHARFMIANVGTTPVSNVVARISGSTNVLVYDALMASSEFVIDPQNPYSCGHDAIDANWADRSGEAYPANSISVEPQGWCYVDVYYNPSTIVPNYSPSTTVSITASGQPTINIGINTNISGVVPSTSLSTPGSFIPGWTGASETGGYDTFMYVPISLADGNEYFKTTGVTLTKITGGTPAANFNLLRSGITADLPDIGPNSENLGCTNISQFREIWSNGPYNSFADNVIDAMMWRQACYVPVKLNMATTSSPFSYSITVQGVTSSGNSVQVTRTISGNGTQIPYYGN